MESAGAARENIDLSRQLLELRPNSILSHSHIHYLFNSALNLELYDLLSPEPRANNRELVAVTIGLLSIDENSNREFAKDWRQEC